MHSARIEPDVSGSVIGPSVTFFSCSGWRSVFSIEKDRNATSKSFRKQTELALSRNFYPLNLP